MKSAIVFLKNWALMVSIGTGILIALLVHFIPALAPYEAGLKSFSAETQPILIGLMLFLQFTRVSPRDMKLQKWHLFVLISQCSIFVILAIIISIMEYNTIRLLLECAMLCIICPTASGSGVITDKLGGKLAGAMSYVVLINCITAVLIPAIIPVIHPSESMNFQNYFFAIVRKIFPILILPCIGAWVIRYTMKKVHETLVRYSHWAFYILSISLTFALILSTLSLIYSKINFLTVILIGVMSLLCCLLQFFFGSKIGNKYSESQGITSRQAFGQKNTGFLIWLGFSFLTPVTSVAGGFYSLWQNIVNSWELHKYRHKNDA